ncbi:Peptidoglycan binding domain-containing protein [Cyclobacterium marinum DSM 745]|uniref:Peptidoglycan binding domain-containing protein n=2 Tax=Cyclobacterium marinum TaxID=104 RepID=G0IY22_CYCMS|nr:Peptidoglycan binding domain-containing protein [Cyclobacterium marinum DSM 745]
MTDFEIAYNKVMGHEGGYHAGTGANAADRGGETYKGIARRFHAKWNGWEIIDGLKKESNFPRNLKQHSQLQGSVNDFYKEHFWETNKLGSLRFQQLKNKLFDIGVNMGKATAATFLQRGFNYLCRGNTASKLKVDAVIGAITISRINQLNDNDARHLYNLLNIQQGRHYLNILDNDSSQEAFTRGWIDRLNLINQS